MSNEDTRLKWWLAKFPWTIAAIIITQGDKKSHVVQCFHSVLPSHGNMMSLDSMAPVTVAAGNIDDRFLLKCLWMAHLFGSVIVGVPSQSCNSSFFVFFSILVLFNTSIIFWTINLFFLSLEIGRAGICYPSLFNILMNGRACFWKSFLYLNHFIGVQLTYRNLMYTTW